MHLLILGGTRFVGRHLVDAALERGHTVTLFTRGKTNPDLYEGVEHLRGDRDSGDLDALKGRTWDAVVDTSGYVPRVVKQSAELLAGAVDKYLFISTISVYEDPMAEGGDEDSPLKQLEDESVEEVTGETYGGLKVLCEQAAETAMPGRTVIVRPGMIVGPYDHTDRFTYWVTRIARGGRVLVPGKPERPVQMIDARDLGVFMIHLLEAGTTGIFNATGAERPFMWDGWVKGMASAAGSDASFACADDAFLQAQEVNGMQMPFWVPEPYHNIFAVSVNRAIAAGLTFRPFAETVRDTLAWDAGREPGERRAGLTPEREAELLAALDADGA